MTSLTMQNKKEKYPGRQSRDTYIIYYYSRFSQSDIIISDSFNDILTADLADREHHYCPDYYQHRCYTYNQCHPRENKRHHIILLSVREQVIDKDTAAKTYRYADHKGFERIEKAFQGDHAVEFLSCHSDRTEHCKFLLAKSHICRDSIENVRYADK